MKFFDKISEIFSNDDDADEDAYEDLDETDNKRSPSAKGSEYRDNKIVNINATTQLEVVLVKPEQFDEARGIADHLNAKRAVVLNLEAINKETSRRLVDFLTGVSYANSATIKRIASATFFITPNNVGVTGDELIDELGL